MRPIPTTDLVVECEEGAAIISTHEGICKTARVNQVGYQVWRLIDGKATLEQIAQKLVESECWSACANAEAVRADLKAFVAALEQDGFVRVEP